MIESKIIYEISHPEGWSVRGLKNAAISEAMHCCLVYGCRFEDCIIEIIEDEPTS